MARNWRCPSATCRSVSAAGISVLSSLAAQRSPLDRLPLRLPVGPVLSRTVCLITDRERHLGPAAASFWQAVQGALDDLRPLTGVTLREHAALLEAEAPQPA